MRNRVNFHDGTWKKYWKDWWLDRPRVYLPNHPNADSTGCLEISILRASNVLGKPVPKGVEIHHYNTTLVICQDLLYHRFLHARQRALIGCGDTHKRKCTLCKNWDDLQNLFTSKNGGHWHRACMLKYTRERHQIAWRYLVKLQEEREYKEDGED